MAAQKLRLWRIFIIGRSAVSGIFLMLLFVLNVGHIPQVYRALFLVATVQFAANGIYFYLWKKRDLIFLGYLCFTLEIALITMLIIGFGPHGHVFMLAYLWPIMVGGWLIGHRAVLPLTLISSLTYSLIFVLERRGIVISQELLTLDGTPQALVLCLPYLAFLALLIWALTTDMEQNALQLGTRNRELHDLNTRLQSLVDAGEYLLGSLDERALWKTAVDQAQRISGCVHIAAFRRESARFLLEQQLGNLKDWDQIHLDHIEELPNSGTALDERLIHIDLQSHHRLEGRLSLLADENRCVEPQDLQIMRVFGHQLAMALENARLVGNLARERNLLSGILASMNEAVIGADASGEILLANVASQRLLQLTENTPVPTWLAQTCDKPQDASAAEDRRIIDREHRSIQISSTDAHSDAAPVSRIYVARDVTHEVEMDRLKTEFLAYASHELRTPLTTIKMMIKLLLMDATPGSKHHEYLRIVDLQTDRQKRLINNLLDITRLEAGKYALPPQKVRPVQAIRSALDVCQPLADEKQIQIQTYCSQAPVSIVSNQVGLEQILMNLISNAIKFTDHLGKVTLTCDQQDDQIVFTVQDTGVGMSPEQLDHVFTKFYTVYHPQKRGEGTGLGLALSRLLARELGGDISVVSEVGTGSCFTVRLPLDSRMPKVGHLVDSRPFMGDI